MQNESLAVATNCRVMYVGLNAGKYVLACKLIIVEKDNSYY